MTSRDVHGYAQNVMATIPFDRDFSPISKNVKIMKIGQLEVPFFALQSFVSMFLQQ